MKSWSKPLSIVRKLAAWLLILIFTTQPALAATEVVVDTTQGKNPTVTHAANGTTVVQILAPNASGLSHNQYLNLQVGPEGLIFNNGTGLIKTQLAGYITGNANLSGGTARIILNEVTGNLPSHLNGFQEVAGNKADLILANPNGIVGSGFGFINANRAVLTTGTPIFGGSGSLEAFRVSGGQMSIDGTGLNAKEADRVDLIARAVKLNAELQGNEVNVITGANQVDYSDNKTTAISASLPDKPAVALDVSALGGMYASKISLIGTEAGVGVNSLGTIQASGDIRLDNAGKISLEKISSTGGNIQIDAQDDITNQGILYASGTATVNSQGTLQNNGTLAAGQKVSVHAQTIQSVGTLAAGVKEDRTSLENQGVLEVGAETINNAVNGKISAQGTTNITAAGTFTNRGLIDGGQTRIETDNLTNIGTGRIYGDDLAIKTNTLTNESENGENSVIAARKRLDIGAKTITNREHALLFSEGEIAIGGSLGIDNHATGKADTLNNNSATIESLGNMNLDVTRINNTNEHFTTYVDTIKTESVTEYQGSGSVNRYLPGTSGVYIYNDESDYLHTPEGNFEVWNAYRYTRTTKETKVKTSDPSKILSGGTMQINADTLNNDKSHIIAGGALSGTINTLINNPATGSHTVTSAGTVTTYWRDHVSGRDRTGSRSAGYNPAAIVQTISLNTNEYQENTVPVGTGRKVDPINTSVPNNNLFHVTPDSNATYLIETDPSFADYRQWISSDYMLKELSYDPSLLEKRLGDGFYEQKLVIEQMAQLTGQNFPKDDSNGEAQYVALMNNAVTFAKTHQLTPGVALSADQMAQLTSNIVWLVEKEVTLPSGETTRVLVPKVYICGGKDVTLTAAGSLIAGNSVDLTIGGDLTNSGTIVGNNSVILTAQNIRNMGGSISGKDVTLTAHTNIENVGGQVVAVNSLTANADGDINVSSTTSTQTNAQGSRTNIDSVGGLYVTGDNGNLNVTAKKDINFNAAVISNNGKGGTTTLKATNNLNLGTVAESESNHIVWDGNNHRSDNMTSDVGTIIQSQGNLTLTAGENLNAKAATVKSIDGTLMVTATAGDVNITTGETTSSADESHQHKEKGFLSSKTITTRDITEETTVQGSIFSGKTITMKADQDIDITGSHIAGTDQVTLTATKGNVSMTSAQQISQEEHLRNEQKSGLFGGGGFGFTIGKKSEKTDTKDHILNEIGSTVGSTTGSVSITAGNEVNSAGTTFITGKDLNITGKEVTIDNTLDIYDSQTTYEFKQTGLSVSLGGGAVTGISNTVANIERSGEVKDERLKALYEYKALQDIKKLGASKGDVSKDVSISVSIGSTKMTSNQTSHNEIVNTSNITAGGNVNITSTEGDIDLKGTKIDAVDITLDAKKNLNIEGAENKEQTTSNTSSSSWSLGGTIGTGFFGNVSKGSGKENENFTTNTESEIDASGTLTLKSGEDTNITGSKVSGEKVVATIGGDLNIASVQDTEDYAAKNQSSGFGFTTGAKGGVTGSVSQGKTDSTYASVTEQAGIFAGKDGFDITVGKNTDLKGAVIASEATPDKNKITTDTLTYSDIQNKAEYDSSSIGVNYATGGDVAKKDQGLTPNIGVTVKGNADSTTHSAISPGIIIVGGVKVDPANLSRDTTNSLNALGKIFDKKTVQEQQELTKIFIEESSKAIGDLADAQLKKALDDAAKTKDKDPVAYQIALQQIALWKTGGDNKILLDSVMGGITASLGGGSFTSGAFSSGLNQALQGELTKIGDPAARQWASFIIGAAASKILGGNALTGGSITSGQTKNNDLNHDQQIQFAADLTLAIHGKGKTTEEVKQNVKDVIQNWININAQSDPNLKATDGPTILLLEDAAETLGITFSYDANDSLTNNLDVLKYKIDNPPTISRDPSYDGLSPERQKTLSDYFNAQTRADQLLFGAKFLGQGWGEKVQGYRNDMYQMAIDDGFAPNYATAFADQATWDLFSAGILSAVKAGGNVVGSGLGNLGGKWVNVNESMSGASRTYQRYIAGTDEVWLQNGVKFDGIQNGVLVEAKGNYASFVDKNTGNFYNWFTGDKALIDQANRQLTAANGMPVNWYFADEVSMNAVSRLFKGKGISDINLILKPLE